MAVIIFPVMAVTVVWAAYTEAVLTRLREIAQEQGRKNVDSFMAWLKEVDQAIRWQLAGTEDKYLQCQGNACQDYTTEGFKQLSSSVFIPQLDEVFVPLELSGSFIPGADGESLPMPPGFKWDKEVIKLLNQPDGLSIWDLLKTARKIPTYRRLVIKAWGGYGKTTLLRHVTYTYTRKRQQRGVPKFLPVLLYLRKWQEVIANQNQLDLPTLIEQHHIPHLPEGKGLKLPPNWAKNHLRQGKMLVMLDGFDEVRRSWRKPVSQWIGEQMKEYPRANFILTSRPASYRDYASENQPTAQLFVKAFNQGQQERFVKRWYLCQERYARGGRNTPLVEVQAEQNTANLLGQLNERRELADLAKNPLLLNMIVNLHRCYPGNQLPQRRTELYREIFRLQLGDRPLARQIELILPADKSQQVLQGLALYMVIENEPQIEDERLVEQLQIHLNRLDEPVNLSEWAKQIEQVSELLVKQDDRYEFAHLSFQGYLAAVEIKQNKQEDLLVQHLQDSWWKETILLYAAQVNPSNLVRELCKIGTPDAIDLAYDCLRESPRLDMKEVLEKDLQNLESIVQNLRYQQLEAYLKNRQWKKADDETYRLMIQTVGKEEGQWFESEDLENFPVQDLRTINQLWLNYSSGRFGFSVQKEIYQSLGGTREYNEKIWRAFSDCVGWIKGEGFMNYSDLTFREDDQFGHLPVRWVLKARGSGSDKRLPEKSAVSRELLLQIMCMHNAMVENRWLRRQRLDWHNNNLNIYHYHQLPSRDIINDPTNDIINYTGPNPSINHQRDIINDPTNDIINYTGPNPSENEQEE